jgi:hypothetical protein
MAGMASCGSTVWISLWMSLPCGLAVRARRRTITNGRIKDIPFSVGGVGAFQKTKKAATSHKVSAYGRLMQQIIPQFSPTSRITNPIGGWVFFVGFLGLIGRVSSPFVLHLLYYITCMSGANISFHKYRFLRLYYLCQRVWQTILNPSFRFYLLIRIENEEDFFCSFCLLYEQLFN